MKSGYGHPQVLLYNHAPKHDPSAYRTFRAFKEHAEGFRCCDLGEADDLTIEQCAALMAEARINDANEKHSKKE